MTRFTQSAPGERKPWQAAIDAASFYLLTHGVQYHEALLYFRRSLLNQAAEIAGSKNRGAGVAGVSRTLYHNKRGPFGGGE